jgi:ParB/RepB/Spo0J family partition protein
MTDTWIDIGTVEFASVEPGQIIFENRAREVYDELDILAESIKDKGVIQPLAVQATDDPDKYLLLAGGRRYSAIVMAQLRPIPVRIFPSDLPELDRKEIELFENIHRMDLAWPEKNKLTREIHALKISQHGIAIGGSEEKRGHSMEDTSKLLGKHKSMVSREIALADAADKYPEIVRATTEAEARRMLNKIKRKETESKAVEKFKQEETTMGSDSVKRRMCNSYAQGDFFELAAQVPNSAANLIEIDPPYAIKLDVIKKTETKNIEGYKEVTEEDYPLFMEAVFAEAHRLLLPSGWVVCWFAFQWYDVIKTALETCGFSVCPIPGFWVKPIATGQTNSPETRLGSVVEPFFYARKGNATVIRMGRSNAFVYDQVPSGSKIHPTERPVELIQDVLSTFMIAGGQIVVPFLGSGNSLLAGSNLGMTGFGFDIDKEDEFKNAYINRVMSKKEEKFSSYIED